MKARCLCHCKDTNFKANHNVLAPSTTGAQVVYATAKILILKQITTLPPEMCDTPELFMPLQRY